MAIRKMNNRDWEAYGIGYQEALKDIQDKLTEGGIEAVEQWLFDNIREPRS